MARAYSVIQPAPPRATKPKTEAERVESAWSPRPGEAFRVTTSGWPREILLLTDDEFDAAALAAEVGGIGEYAFRYGYKPLGMS